MSYDGHAYVREQGKRTAQVDPLAACKLMERAASSLRSVVEYEGAISHCKGDPRATLMFEVGDAREAVEVDFTAMESCRPDGFPTELIGLANAIDAVTGTAAWVECRDADGKNIACDLAK